MCCPSQGKPLENAMDPQLSYFYTIFFRLACFIIANLSQTFTLLGLLSVVHYLPSPLLYMEVPGQQNVGKS